MTSDALGRARWRQRFRQETVTLPTWAVDMPSRCTYFSNGPGVWQMFAWEHGAAGPRQVTDRAEGTAFGGIEPSGDTLWWFGADHGDDVGRWFVQPFAAGPARHATPGVPPAEQAGIALGRGFAVVGWSGASGSAIHVVRGDAARGDAEPRRIYAHDQPVTVVGASPSLPLIAVDHSEVGDIRHPAVRVIDLDGGTVGDLWDGAGLGLWAGDWSPVRGDHRLIVRHERYGRSGSLIWDPVAGTIREIQVELVGELDASWYPDATALLIVRDHGGRSTLHRFDIATGALDTIDTEAGTIDAAAVRPDGQVWHRWTSSAVPLQVRCGRERILPVPAQPAPEGVPYTAHDIGGVPVFVAEPRGHRPHPTIVLLHGGPRGQDRDAYSPEVQAWVEHGFAVALVNYRGSVGYGLAWRDAIDGSPGFTELADVTVAHDGLVGCGIADPRRSVLAGHSWGGYLTLLGLGTQPERWAVGVAGVPLADLVGAHEDVTERRRAVHRSLFGGSPAELPELYRERSPVTYVERLRAPVLIIAGEHDPACPIRQIETYVAALARHGKRHEVHRYEGGHTSLVTDETIRQVERSIAFVARHLGTQMPA